MAILEHGASVFVGRANELDLLEAAVRGAGRGRGNCVLLVGDAGIGKTRTVEEALSRSGWPAERTFWGRCPGQGGVPAFWPWVQILRRWSEQVKAADLGTDDGGARSLVALLPELAPSSAAGSDATEPEDSRFALFDSVVSSLRRYAAHSPVVLVLEDVHWADEASLRLLLFAAGELRDVGCAILATCRGPSSWQAPGYADLVRVSERLELHGLEPTEVEAFVKQTAAEERVTTSFCAEVAAASGGNPFFLREILQLALREAADRTRLDSSALRPSEDVRAVIRRNLAPLEPQHIDLLTTAAVIGREFDSGLLARISGASLATVMDTLFIPAARRVVEPIEPQGRFRFVHALIGEALSGDLAPSDRARRHLQVALALEAAAPEGRDGAVAEIAWHYYHAAPLGHANEAIDWSCRAGAEASARFAFESAAEHYERALAALSLREPDTNRQIELELAIGEAHLHAVAGGEARRHFEIAFRLARTRGDRESLARVAAGLASVRLELYPGDAQLPDALSAALNDVAREPSALRCSLLTVLIASLHGSRDRDHLDALSHEAIELARAQEDSAAISAALLARHIMLWGRNSIEERRTLGEEALSLAIGARRRNLVVQALGGRFVDLVETGDIGAAELLIEPVLSDESGARLAWILPGIYSMQAALDAHRGRLDDALENLDLAQRSLPERHPEPWIDPCCRFQRLMIARDKDGVVGEADDLAPFLGTHRRLSLPRALGELDQGRPERARAVLDDLLRSDLTTLALDGSLTTYLAIATELAHGLGDGAAAERLYEELREFDGLNVYGLHPGLSLGAASRYLGLAAATKGDLDRAVLHLEQAVEQNRGNDAPGQRIRSQIELADLRAKLGDHETASALLGEARAAANSHGMPALARLVEARTTDTPNQPPPPGEPTPTEETPTRSDRFEASLIRQGEGWLVSHGAVSAQLRDSRGLILLCHLLRQPRQEFHVLDLDSADAAPAPAKPKVAAAAQAGLDVHPGSDAGEMLDPEARRTYRARAQELREELAEAEEWGDVGRAEKLRQELEFLVDELARGTGLGGRARKASSVAERTRLKVTRAIRRVIRRIADVHPAVGQHLDATIKTGTFCSYEPDPRLPVEWDL